MESLSFIQYSDGREATSILKATPEIGQFQNQGAGWAENVDRKILSFSSMSLLRSRNYLPCLYIRRTFPPISSGISLKVQSKKQV